MATKDLGNDPTLAPGGISVTGEMEDAELGAGETEDFYVRVKNDSSTPVPNYRIFVNRIAGPVNVMPANVRIPSLDPGEQEECHFLVQNPTNATQTNYRFRVRSSYFGVVNHTYQDFVSP